MVYNRFEYTKQKLSEGISQRKIAKDLGVDHATIAYWIKHNFSTGTRSSTIHSDNEIIELCRKHPSQYSYILGSYLGDGHITKLSRTFKLTIYNDVKYQDIIDDQSTALKILFPNNVVSCYKQLHSNCTEVMVHNSLLPRIFPQHGAGKKHDRDVSLTDWQWDIVWKEPECFIKGLIDSDGSYFLYTYKKQSQMKYQFTNKSSDIISMYLKVMEMLGISTKPTMKKCGTVNVFTNKKDDVIKLDKLYEIADNKLSN